MSKNFEYAISLFLSFSIAVGSTLPSLALAKEPGTVTQEQFLNSVVKLSSGIPQNADAPEDHQAHKAPVAPDIDDDMLSLEEMKAKLLSDAAEEKAHRAKMEASRKPRAHEDGLPGKELSSTMIITMMIASAQVIREATNDARLHNKTLTDEENWALYVNTSKTLLRSEDFWMGVTGSKMVQPVNLMIKAWAQDPALNAHVAGALANGMSQLLTQVVWILCAQLWKQNVQKLPVKWQDKARGVALRVFRKMNDPSISNAVLEKDEDYLILQAIVTGIVDTVFVDPVMREDWIDNAFRLQIGNGEVLLFTIAMGTATFVTSTFLVPAGVGAITAWTICVGFGIEAGLMTMAFTPKSWMDHITDRIRDARLYLTETELEGNEADMRIVTFRYRKSWVAAPQFTPRLLRDIRRRRDLRQDEMTARIEKFYDLSLEIQRAQQAFTEAKTVIQHEQELAEMPIYADGKWAKLSDFQPAACQPKCSTAFQWKEIERAIKFVDDAKDALREMEKQMLNVYMHEIHLFAIHLETPSEIIPLEVSQAYDFELKWTCVTARSLGAMFASVTPQFVDDLKLDHFDSEAREYDNPVMRAVGHAQFNYAELNRFKEAVFLGSLDFSRQMINQYGGDFRQSCKILAHDFQPNPVFQ